MRNKSWSTYPWWLLLVGFVFGVMVTLVVTQGCVQTVPVYVNRGVPEDLLLQATRMVYEATLTAQSPLTRLAPIDPILATATAIAVQAGQQSGAPSEPIMLTATAIVAQATAMAAQAGR